jgi:hypothetical protein
VQVAAAWVTVKSRPLTLTVPVREVNVVLGAIVTATVPLPLPLAPELTMIQATELAALHRQPVPAVTLMLAESPAAGEFLVAGEIV